MSEDIERADLIRRLETAKQDGLSIGECWNLMDLAAALLEADKAGGEPVAVVEVSVPHLRSIIVKAVTGATIPPEGTLLYTRPPEARQPPDGWVLVPVEPTPGMLYEGVNAAGATKSGNAWCPNVWSAMLSAAPKP